MAGLSGIVKKISDLVTGTPADDDCFIFGKTDFKKITLAKLKDALGGLEFIDTATTGDNGGTALSMQNQLKDENLYIIFIRHLNGADDCYEPYALLLFVRSQNYQYTTIGTPRDLKNTQINNGRLTINFNSTQWARMWIYKIS